MKKGKWSLIHTALANNSETNGLEASIHRFQGYKVLNTRRFFWAGFITEHTFNVDDNQNEFQAFVGNCFTELDKLDFSHLRCVALFFESLQFKAFEQFLGQVSCDCRIIDHRCQGDSGAVSATLEFFDSNHFPLFTESVYTAQSLASTVGPCVEVLTRENRSAVRAQGLLSHRLHGVDYTGCVRVWPSEGLLLHVLFGERGLQHRLSGKHVLELGGGMTAVCGLGLALASTSSGGPLCASVTLSDGHPDCVRNQRFCVAMNQRAGRVPRAAHVQVQHLLWTEDAGSVDSGDAMETERRDEWWDVLLGSDLLFFEHCHRALLDTICRSLRRDASAVALLLQPPRAGSMARFLDLVQRDARLVATVETDYDPQVSALRGEYLRVRTADAERGADTLLYDEDIHYPQLITLAWRPLAG